MEPNKETTITPGTVEISGWPLAVFLYLIYKAFVVLVTGKARMRTNCTTIRFTNK
jgi:hypothetical protein